MRKLVAACAVALILVPNGARSMMAPKYERARALWAAMQHLQEITSLLADPIDKIEYVDGVFRFSAGKCFVPVEVAFESGSDGSNQPPPLGGGSWSAAVGKPTCQ